MFTHLKKKKMNFYLSNKIFIKNKKKEMIKENKIVKMKTKMKSS